jgi:photosystem I P700 chlorophyll a apoprotein A2
LTWGSDFDKDNHIWRSTYGAGNTLLTFAGSLKADTQSLYLSDISHHHLAIGCIFIIAGHLYRTFFASVGHRIRDILVVNGNSPKQLVNVKKSLHLSLAYALFALGSATSMVAQHTYSLLPYVYLSYLTSVALYIHHQYIATLLMTGSLIHFAIFIIRDYVAYTNSGLPITISNANVVDQILSTKGQFISHLSWA